MTGDSIELVTLQNKKNSSFRLLLSLVMGIAAVSCGAVFVRFTHAEGMPALSIAAWRMIFSCAVLLPYAALTRRAEIVSVPRREFFLMAVAGICLGLHFATWIVSLSLTSVASSVVLVSMGPLFAAIGSWALLRERPGRATIIGLALAAGGSVIIGGGDFRLGEHRLLGDVLALAGAVFIAGYFLVGRRLRQRRSLIAYIAPVYGIAMVTLLGVVVMTRQPMTGFSISAYSWALALALVPQLIGHTTLNWALARFSATFVALITLAEPVGASILAWLLLGESVTILAVVGALPVLTGIFIASKAELTK